MMNRTRIGIAAVLVGVFTLAAANAEASDRCSPRSRGGVSLRIQWHGSNVIVSSHGHRRSHGWHGNRRSGDRHGHGYHGNRRSGGHRCR
jgi:hypothetical protein